MIGNEATPEHKGHPPPGEKVKRKSRKPWGSLWGGSDTIRFAFKENPSDSDNVDSVELGTGAGRD